MCLDFPFVLLEEGFETVSLQNNFRESSHWSLEWVARRNNDAPVI